MTTVLVSGGTGLVGRYIVEHLIAHGYRVKVGTRHAPGPDLFSRDIAHVPLTLDPDADQIGAFDKVDHFVHAAFSHLPGRYRGGEGDDPGGFLRQNLDGTVRLFEAARRAGVRRTVFLSSRAVYDGLPAGQALDESRPLAPTTLYGDVKYKVEQALAAMSEAGFRGISLRVTGVYGDLRPNKWDELFADYLAGRTITPRAGSEVHGRDVAAAIQLMLEIDSAQLAGQIFNVSDLVTDTRDILAPLKAVRDCPHPLPEAADKSTVREMPTDRIRGLGWTPGGKDLLEATVASLARTA